VPGATPDAAPEGVTGGVKRPREEETEEDGAAAQKAKLEPGAGEPPPAESTVVQEEGKEEAMVVDAAPGEQLAAGKDNDPAVIGD
jgi:hypothetical protein